MFKSNSLLFNDSAPWDPFCVRNFLTIPEDQLNLISNIPEWSSKDNKSPNVSPIISVKEHHSNLKDCEQEIPNSEKIQKEKNILLFEKNLELRREIIETFVSHKKISVLTRRFSFCSTDEFSKLSKNNYKLKQSSSVSSIYQAVSCETASVLTNLKSHDHRISKVLSLEHSKSKICYPELSYSNFEDKRVLNKTFTVSSFLKPSSQCSVHKEIKIKSKLRRQHLSKLSKNTDSVDKKMSEMSVKQISHDINNHGNQSSTISPVSESDAIDHSKVSDNNVTCQALREISPTNQIATSEITSFPKEHTKHSFEHLEDKDSSQKENAEILNTDHVEKVAHEKCSSSQGLKNSISLDSVAKENIVHHSQNSLESGESKEKQNDILCAHNSSNIYLDESTFSQAIPCGQKPSDNVTTVQSLNEENENLLKVPSNLDSHLSNEPQTSASFVQDVQQGPILSTENEHSGTTLCTNETDKTRDQINEKKSKSNQKKRKSSHGKQVKGLPSLKYARADEISFSSSQLEKMLNLMKIYLDV